MEGKTISCTHVSKGLRPKLQELPTTKKTDIIQEVMEGGCTPIAHQEEDHNSLYSSG